MSETTVALSLVGAKLCLQCEVIYQGQACPACGSETGWPISRWLNRRKQ